MGIPVKPHEIVHLATYNTVTSGEVDTGRQINLPDLEFTNEQYYSVEMRGLQKNGYFLEEVCLLSRVHFWHFSTLLPCVSNIVSTRTAACTLTTATPSPVMVLLGLLADQSREAVSSILDG